VPNTCVFTIKVTGDGREAIKSMFDRAEVPTDFGCAWNFTDYEECVLCQSDLGDGITVEPSVIVIKGERGWQPPLTLVMKLSAHHPELEFEVDGCDLINNAYQRWHFQAGNGWLQDCVKGRATEESEYDCEESPETVYMRNGEQLLPLPEWVAVEDRFKPLVKNIDPSGPTNDHDTSEDHPVADVTNTYEDNHD
jgi:hypothetical protein